jgi:hypothetical protein
MNTTTQKKPRTPSMRWQKLGEDKDPEFGTPVFLYDEKANEGDQYDIGRLTTKTQKVYGFQYGFITPVSVENDEHPEVTRFTHYCTPVEPVKE